MPKRENSNGLLSKNDDSDFGVIISEIQPWGKEKRETRKQGDREKPFEPEIIRDKQRRKEINHGDTEKKNKYTRKQGDK